MEPPIGPPVPSKELLDWLEKQFTFRGVGLEESERSIFFRAGQAEVVKILKHAYARAHPKVTTT